MLSFLRQHRIEAVFALCIFTVHGYFYGGQGWNQNAQFDGIFSAVEAGTLYIDRFIVDAGDGINTGDWSVADGHYYSNKAPGTVFLGIPFYWVVYHVERMVGLDAGQFALAHFNAYLINLWLSVLFGALAGAVFLKWLRQCFPDQPGKTVAVAATCFLSTLVFPFDSQVWGHPTAAYFILFAWVLANLDGRGETRHFCAGACLGAAVLLDYTATIALVFVGIFYLTRADLRPHVLRLVVGGLPLAVVLMGYHKIVFGTFLATAVTATNPIFTSKDLVGGLFGSVDLSVVYRLLFSKVRGLFVYVPVLVFAIPAAFELWQREQRQLVLICILSIMSTLLLLSTFVGWHGGWTTGPRYLIVVLPFFFILLSGVPYFGSLLARAFYVAAAFSGFQMLAIAATNVNIPNGVPSPLALVYRWFFSGNFEHYDRPVRVYSGLTPEQWSQTKFNLGEILGLSGLASLIPVLLVAAIFGLWLRRLATTPSSPGADGAMRR